jgi:hypothetical protein
VEANRADAPSIGLPDSRIELHVIATDKEAMIAHHTLETLRRPEAPYDDAPRRGRA